MHHNKEASKIQKQLLTCAPSPAGERQVRGPLGAGWGNTDMGLQHGATWVKRDGRPISQAGR